MTNPTGWSIILHGGATEAGRGDMTPAVEAAHRAGLAAALEAGANILKAGGSALDAVETAVCVLEDDPLFNAGRGAVFDAVGRNRLDASIMDGATRKAGAVAGVARTRHPVSLARAVMDRSVLVMLIGDGADSFAQAQGLEQVDPAFFRAEDRWAAFEAERDRLAQPPPPTVGKGTVGAVARDAAGHLAAATSTGGFTGKPAGRVGDSAVIGAGTYADAACAISATGAGEYFIRLGAAREVCALVEHKGLGVQQAADAVIHAQLVPLGGSGGLIAIGRDGSPVWSCSIATLFRAIAVEGEPPWIGVFTDEG